MTHHTWRRRDFRCGSAMNNWGRWSDSAVKFNVAMENSKNVSSTTRDVEYQTEIGGGIKNKITIGISDY